MPWCEGCDRFLSPSTVAVDGTCPRCGRVVEPGRAHRPSEETSPLVDEPLAREAEHDPADDESPLPPVPWHLKMLAGAVAIYLGYRAYQGIEWLVHRL